ncbi:hypothetical protein DFH09DRAFT_1468971 [Mycena vulgaris]|nr:hypothetical protein DFH09DRAFT_1468971 [Mycena vulgaris]
MPVAVAMQQAYFPPTTAFSLLLVLIHSLLHPSRAREFARIAQDIEFAHRSYLPKPSSSFSNGKAPVTRVGSDNDGGLTLRDARVFGFHRFKVPHPSITLISLSAAASPSRPRRPPLPPSACPNDVDDVEWEEPELYDGTPLSLLIAPAPESFPATASRAA